MKPMKLRCGGALAGLGLWVTAAWMLSASATAQAGVGDLDPTFGSGGKVVSDFGSVDSAGAIALLSDGKTLVAGATNVGGSFDFALARYNVDGSLDASFGTAGLVLTDFGGTDRARFVVVLSDGKIVVLGESDANGGFDFALARYNVDGSLDASFGSAGTVLTDVGGSERGRAIAIQSDGRIVVAGNSDASGSVDFALARYNVDGSLDASFGSAGTVLTDFGGDDFGLAGAIQSDGKIVMGGRSDANGDLDFALARYDVDGNLDASFGTAGTVLTDFGGDEFGRPVVIQGDGKIVLAGGSNVGGDFDFALARYNVDGSLDASFGTAGMVLTDFGGFVDNAWDVAIQSDAKIVVVGNSNADGSFDRALARYNIDGSLDTSFGTAGLTLTDFGGDEFGGFAAIHADGKIVVVGISSAGGNVDFALSRYLGDPAPLLESLIGQVEALAEANILNGGQANSLVQKVNNILAKIASGRDNAALNQLSAFISQVNDLVGEGVLTPEEGQGLIDTASNASNALDC